jgi:hypothetical protein
MKICPVPGAAGAQHTHQRGTVFVIIRMTNKIKLGHCPRLRSTGRKLKQDSLRRQEIRRALSKIQCGTIKKEVVSKKAALREACERKERIYKPLHVQIELLLSEYNISSAAYHGGKLNGVVCRRLMHYASKIFSDIFTSKSES